MEEWKTYKIGDLCNSVSETYKRGSEKVVLINTSDVLDGKCDNHSFVDNRDLKGQFKKTFQKDDILYSEIRPANKRFAYIDFDATDYIASTKLMVIRANSKVLPRFLYHNLKSQSTLDELQALAESRSGTFPQITFSELANLELQIPSLISQEKIVRFIDAIESKIDLNNRINHNLEEQAQALYKSWFVDFEPFRGGNFVDSELGMIPEGWRVAELGTVTRQCSQKVKDRIDVKVLSPVTTGELVLSEEYFTKQVFSESISKYIVVKPLHFAYNPARVNIGSIGMNMFSFDGCVSPVYVVFECEKGYHHFFDYYRKTASFKDEVLNRAIGGVRQTLSYKDFALIKLVYPPYDIVEKFNCIYAGLLENKNSIKREISKLSELRDTLLPKLLSGELKIDDFTC